VVGASALACWFVLIGIMLSDGPLARRLLGVFVLLTVPGTLAIAVARRRELMDVRTVLVLLGLAFVAVELLALRHPGTGAARFSPIRSLDPISAALAPAIGCVAAMAYRPTDTARRVAQLTACGGLAVGTGLPAARGPLLALAVTATFLALGSMRPRLLAVPVTVLVASLVGFHLGQRLENRGPTAAAAVGQPGPAGGVTVPAVSSSDIRRRWLREAIDAAPHRPIFGHGVGMLVDHTPEARAMGVYGERVYPHNDFVEAAYSLGAPGLILFLVFVFVPVFALIKNVALRNDPLVAFAGGLFVFALFEANVSGEIGEDVLLWSSAVFVLGATQLRGDGGSAPLLRRPRGQ